MTSAVRQDEIVQQAIRKLFIGSVPERADELSSLWEDLDLVFHSFLMTTKMVGLSWTLAAIATSGSITA